jgi:hypothetical protein
VNSPLGKYAAATAAIAGIGLIASYVLAVMLQHVLLLDATTLSNLHDLAILACGAIFGSAVAVNGYKAPLIAAHARIDALQKEIDANVVNTNTNTANIAKG